MSGILQNNYWFSDAASSLEIGNTLRFRGGQKLQGNVVGVTNQPYTASMWVKFADITSSNQTVFGRQYSNQVSAIEQTVGNLNFREGGNDSSADGVNRDPSAWKHICWTIAGSDSSAQTVWINGVQQSLTSGVITQSSAFGWNIGARFNNTAYFNGYIAEVHFIDNQQLNQYSFGQYNAQGVWVPKAYKGSYGTNGFYLNFSDSNNIGEDSSGNGNDFTASGFQFQDSTNNYLVGSDQVSDSPTNNYFHYNPLNQNQATMNVYAANTYVSTSAAGTQHTGLQQLGPSTDGKYAITSLGAGGPTNIRTSQFNFYATRPTTQGSGSLFFSGWYQNANNDYYSMRIGAGSTLYKFLVAKSALVGYVGYIVVVDEPAGKYWLGYFLANDPSSVTYASATAPISDNPTANPDTGTSPTGTFTPGLSLYYDTGFSTPSAASGAASGPYRQWEDFVPQIPNITTFSHVNNSERLPAATIPDPSDHFDVITDTGANILTAAQSKFSNGLWWVKDRVNVDENQLVDSLRGGSLMVASSAAASESSYITPTGDSVAWCWKAGASASNNLGSLSSTTAANPTAGFSIVTWTGNGSGSAETIGHGLSTAPEVVFLKSRSDGIDGWYVYHSGLIDASYALFLNLRLGPVQNNGYWNSTSPSSSVFTVGSITSLNRNNDNYVAYCWAPVAGYSSFGSYDGNSSTDGPFVYTGFQPEMVMVKSTQNANRNWYVIDGQRSPYNPVENDLYWNRLEPENSGTVSSTPDTDFCSNGFKLRTTDNAYNLSGTSFIYMAFAKHPFGGSNVAPATAR